MLFFFFFFNDTATTEIYTLSLHDALPISPQLALRELDFSQLRNRNPPGAASFGSPGPGRICSCSSSILDRKSTRLNSSHGYISYAVFCLKKKTISTNAYDILAYVT